MKFYKTTKINFTNFWACILNQSPWQAQWSMLEIPRRWWIYRWLRRTIYGGIYLRTRHGLYLSRLIYRISRSIWSGTAYLSSRSEKIFACTGWINKFGLIHPEHQNKVKSILFKKRLRKTCKTNILYKHEFSHYNSYKNSFKFFTLELVSNSWTGLNKRTGWKIGQF